MACNCGKNRVHVPSTQTAAAAGSATSYEVLTASGDPTGRRYTSLILATREARKIGGSTRPV